jgi:hypothetical protein
MKAIRFITVARWSLLAFGLTLASTAYTQTTSGAPATATVPQDKLVTRYSEFAGSTENATALVQGLRTGAHITLSTAPGVNTTTFAPPTRPMGYGNVRIALALAQNQLASQGITNPTPTQLQGALMGSTNPTGTYTHGVLEMRASGMGWGQIANAQGAKVGTLMSGKTVTSSGMGSAAGGTVSAAGTSASHGSGNAYGQTQSGAVSNSGYPKHSGVVTGMGNVAGGTVSAAGTGASHGGGNAYGQANSAAVSNAGGNSHGGGSGGNPGKH